MLRNIMAHIEGKKRKIGKNYCSVTQQLKAIENSNIVDIKSVVK